MKGRAWSAGWGVGLLWGLGVLTWIAKVATDGGANPGILTALQLISTTALVVWWRAWSEQGRKWLDGWRLILLLAGLWQLGGVYGRVGGDGFEYYVTLRSSVIDGDLSFANDYAGIGAKPVVSPSGQVITRMPIGVAIAWSGSFLVVHATMTLLVQLGMPATADGFGIVYQSTVTSTSFVLAFAALMLIEGLLRRRVGSLLSLIATLLVWFATPLAYYMAVTPSMSHACSMAVATLLTAWWLRIRETGGHWSWALAGLLAGWLGVIRLQDIVFAVIPATDLLLTRRPGWLKQGRAFAGGACVLPLLQIGAWAVEYGSGFASAVLASAPVRRGFTPAILDFLFAARHGVFSWTPLYLVAIAGWLLLWRKERVPVASFIVAFAAATWVNASIDDWWASDSFGQRRLLCFTPVFALGVGEALSLLHRRPMALVALLAVALMAWNQQLATIFNSAMVGPRNQALSLEKVASAQVDVAYRQVARLRPYLPNWLLVLLYDNLKGVWLDEGSRHVAGRIDFGQEPADFSAVIGFNWLEPSHDDGVSYRRSRNRRSWLHLPIRTVDDFRGTVRLRSEMGTAVPLEVRVEMNGHPLGSFHPNADWGEFAFSIPKGTLRSGFNDLVFWYSALPREAIPGWTGPNSAVAVDWLRLDRLERPAS